VALGAAKYGYFEPAGGAGGHAKSVLQEGTEWASRAGFVVASAGGT